MQELRGVPIICRIKTIRFEHWIHWSICINTVGKHPTRFDVLQSKLWVRRENYQHICIDKLLFKPHFHTVGSYNIRILLSRHSQYWILPISNMPIFWQTAETVIRGGNLQALHEPIQFWESRSNSKTILDLHFFYFYRVSMLFVYSWNLCVSTTILKVAVHCKIIIMGLWIFIKKIKVIIKKYFIKEIVVQCCIENIEALSLIKPRDGLSWFF